MPGKKALGFTLLLPLGSIIYISLPPARDFATSGLENGLVIFWIACLWCMFLAWTRRDPARTDWQARTAFLFLAFVAGLAPLIRPEITVLGALVLLVLFCAPIGWRLRVGMVVAAAVVPVGYQIFRMGYYAVLVPNPNGRSNLAVAIQAPIIRLTHDKALHFLPALQRAAQALAAIESETMPTTGGDDDAALQTGHS